MKRSCFARKPYSPSRDKRMTRVEGCTTVMRRVDGAVTAMPKDKRDMLDSDEEKLWKHVRSLDCQLCFTSGGTQVAHSNSLADGKGRAIKAWPWKVAALCYTCHGALDQGSTKSKEERREDWELAHMRTISLLFSEGLVRPV